MQIADAGLLPDVDAVGHWRLRASALDDEPHQEYERDDDEDASKHASDDEVHGLDALGIFQQVAAPSYTEKAPEDGEDDAHEAGRIARWRGFPGGSRVGFGHGGSRDGLVGRELTSPHVRG